MAVTATAISSDLVLVMDNGTGASGQPLSVNRVFRNVKTAASNDDVYSVAESILGLQSKTNNAIQRRNLVELEEE